jgi:hypothetical protein
MEQFEELEKLVTWSSFIGLLGCLSVILLPFNYYLVPKLFLIILIPIISVIVVYKIAFLIELYKYTSYLSYKEERDPVPEFLFHARYNSTLFLKFVTSFGLLMDIIVVIVIFLSIKKFQNKSQSQEPSETNNLIQ